MKTASLYLVVSMILLSAMALVSGALARGGQGVVEESEARAFALVPLFLISAFPTSTS